MQPNFLETTTIRDYLKVIFRHKILFIIVPIAILIPVYISLEFQTPRYEASVKMFIKALKPIEAAYYKGLIIEDVISDHAELVKSKVVLARVVEALKLYEIPLDYEKKFASPIKAFFIDYNFKKMRQQRGVLPPDQMKNILFRAAIERLGSSINVSRIKQTNFIKITVSHFNPQLAVKMANSLSRSYVIFDLEQQIAELKLVYGENYSTVIQLENYIKEFQNTLDGKLLPPIEAIGPASIKIIEQALTATQVSGLPKNLFLILAFFASIIFSTIFAFLLDFLDNTFKSPEDIERFLNLPVLGSIPKEKTSPKLLMGGTQLTRKYYLSYQNLCERIYLLMNDNNLKSILICDTRKSDEAAVITFNLGFYLAKNQGYKVLIIDANLRFPAISRFCNISDNPGLTNVLEEGILVENAIQDLDNNLYVLAAAKNEVNPITLLESHMMLEVIDKAKERYDLIFITCADIKNYNDVAILSAVTDGIAIVIDEGQVRRQVIQGTIMSLEQKKANLIGVIFNNRTFTVPDIIYKLS